MIGLGTVRRGAWFIPISLLWGLCASDPAAAQVLDRIEILSTTRTAAEIRIVFSTPVIYQSHFPVTRSDLVRIDLILPQLDQSENIRRERLTSPPSNVVPPFTVSFPDRKTNRTLSLTVKFDRPVDLRVRGAKDDRNSIVLSLPVKPALQAPEAPLSSLQAKAPPNEVPPTLPASEERTKDQSKSPPIRTTKARKGAQLVADVKVVPHRAFADIHIKFKVPVGYLYHHPNARGDFVRVWLVMLEVDRSGVLAPQVVLSPPNDLVPQFTVTFPEQEDNRSRSLAVKFAESVEFAVRVGKGNREIIISVPLKNPILSESVPPQSPEGPAGSPGGQVIAPGASVRESADELMAKGRAALTAGENEKATQIFNRLLNLPPNQHSQDAQELVGLARERSGEITKARAEYQLYLKLYPDGEGAARVRQRLAVLQEFDSKMPVPKRPKERERRSEMKRSLFGNLTQYFFGGTTKRETRTTISGVETTASDSSLDQALLVSTLNLTGQARSRQYDNRVVLRGSNNFDMRDEAERESEFRVRSAYLKHEDKERLYMIQFGRQPGSFAGILTPFDGGWFRYGLLQELGFNFVGGVPQESTLDISPRLDFGHYFYGGDLYFGPLGGGLSGDAYFFSQTVDGIVDRQAAGGELRYASGGLSAFSLVDYDLSYGELNIAMLNGSWQTAAGTTLTLLMDHRKTPSMQTRNGLLATGSDSVKAALLTITEDELRQHARALTAETDLFQFGLMHPITSKWQLGGDVGLTRTSGTEAAGSQPALPGTGNIWTYTARAIGSNVVFPNHTLTVNATYIDNPGFQGQSLGVNSLARFGDAWQLDLFATVFYQKDKNNVRLVRVTPSMRLSYRWNEHMTFEIEGGIEKADTDALNQEDSSLRKFFFVGYIWQQ